MKKIFLTSVILLVAFTLRATNYYFKSAGNDGNTGLSDAQAWTYAKLSTFSFAAGDTAFLKRGETYYGTITPATSGTFANRIVFSAYGTGAKPIVTGFTTITGWTNEGGGIYSKVISAASTPNVVTINGVNTALGRYPNAGTANGGYLTVDSYTGTTSITDAATPSSTTNWTGAIMMLRFDHWLLGRCPVTNHSGTTITYTNPSSYLPRVGFGFFFQNDIRTLDQFGEWCYVGGKLSMYFGGANPDSYTIKMSTIDRCISLASRSYITILNLNLQGANVDGVYSNASYNTIKDCDISFCGDNGINLWSSSPYNTVEGCTINHIQNRGIFGLAANQTIRNCTIKNIALLHGMGNSINNGQMAIACQGTAGYSDNTLIEYNRVDSIGYQGILFKGNNSIARYNYVTNFNFNLDDGGGIYVGGNNYTGRRIYNNVVVNNSGNTASLGTDVTTISAMGVYLDNNSANVAVFNNSISDVNYGIYLHGSHETEVHDNIVYNSDFGIAYYSTSSLDPMRNNNVSRNVVYATKSTQYVMYHGTWTTDVALFGAIDSNYYMRPSLETTMFKTVTAGATNYRTFTQWKAYSSLDAHSFTTPYSSSEVLFYYNETTSNKVISLADRQYRNVKGTTYTGSITLLPFTSELLFKNDAYSPNPAVLSIVNLNSITPLSRGANIISNLVDNGGGTITARGVCWGISANPTIAGNKTNDGTALGSFTSTITGLLPNTTYHVRSYVTNEAGTAYSADYTFTTTAWSTGSVNGKIGLVNNKVVYY